MHSSHVLLVITFMLSIISHHFLPSIVSRHFHYVLFTSLLLACVAAR